MHALKGVVMIMTLTIAVLMTLIVYGMYQKSQDPSFKFFDLSGDEESVSTSPTAPQAPPQAVPQVMPQMAGNTNTPTSGTPTLSTGAFGDIIVPLPTGARITSTTLSGDRLVIVVSGDGQMGDQVWVIDLASGQIIGRVKTQP